MPENQNGVSIKKAAQLTGLSERQIRYYGQKGLITPDRTAGGHRIFSAADLERLKLINELHQAGYSLGIIREKLASQNSSSPLSRQAITNLFPSAAVRIKSIYPIREQAKVFHLLTKQNPFMKGTKNDDTRGDS